MRIALFLQTRFPRQREGLVLIGVGRDFPIAVCLHIKEVKMLNRGFHLARHLIFVGLKRRTRRGHRIDYPQLFYLPLVRSGHGKVTRIGRPDDSPNPFPFPVAKRIGVQQTIRLPEAKIFFPEGSQLYIRHR